MFGQSLGSESGKQILWREKKGSARNELKSILPIKMKGKNDKDKYLYCIKIHWFTFLKAHGKYVCMFISKCFSIQVNIFM